jgi:tRNA(Ile)-lysidine synthase
VTTGEGGATAPDRALAAALAQVFPDNLPEALGVALSGGGDSVALSALLADWCAPRGVVLRAVTVDHGLRRESAAEAAGAARLCARLGIAHDTLCWQGWDGRGNLQDAARRARQRLIADWAQAQGLAAVALGHTEDDQAETVLLRLARGSGVDGLSGMAPARQAGGVLWLRPLVAVPRAALRAMLAARGLEWVEDPSNREPRFARVRARAALAALAPLGITAARLSDTAARMALARAALAAAAQDTAARLCRVEAGDLLIGRAGLLAAPQETRERLMAQALRWVGSADYPPRRAALQRLLARVTEGRGGTLHGCEVSCEGAELRIRREWQAVRELRAAACAPWDGRWRLEGPAAPGMEVAALGPRGLAALAHLPARSPGGPAADASGGDISGQKMPARAPRGTGRCGGGDKLPRRSLMVTPAVWRGDELVAAPPAGLERGWRVAAAPDPADFLASVLSH